MDELVLADIQALAASIDYGGRGYVQPSSAALGLSAALFLSDLTVWRGAGYKLTDGEIDDIEAMIAQLEEDLMLTGDMYAMDKVSLTTSADIDIPTATETTIHWDVDVYDPESMHGVGANDYRINVVRDGLHLINVNIVFSFGTPGYRTVALRKYGYPGPANRLIRGSTVQGVGGTTEIGIEINAQDEAVVGEYYYVRVYQTATGTLQLKQRDSSPFFSVVRL